MKAILLHHAGGDKYAFRQFTERIKDTYTVCALELPGRGDRFQEPFITTFDEALDDFMLQLSNEIHEPYFIVGISMGAAFAYELTHRLQEDDLLLPKALFLCSRRSEEDYTGLTKVAFSEKEIFWEHVITFDERTRKLMHHPELMEMYEPLLRADFAILEDYHTQYSSKKAISIPAYILYGKEDVQKNDEQTSANWKKHFSSVFEVKLFDGGHFFLYENEDAANYIKTKINA